MYLFYVIMYLNIQKGEVKMNYQTYDCPVADKKLKDFNPLVFGEQHCPPSYSFGPASRGHYLIHYVVSGKGRLYIGKNAYIIRKNQAFIIKPDEFAKYTADSSEPWHYIWIGFKGELAKKFDTLQSPVIDVKTDIFTEMLSVRYLKNTIEEFLAGKLFCYYSLVFDSKEKADYVSQVINYINAYYTTFDCTVEKISGFINLERHYLARIFRQKTGKTVKEFITEKRMTNAKKLIENGFDVKTTSELSGYSDQFVFSKAFKKYYGISPIKSRKNSL